MNQLCTNVLEIVHDFQTPEEAVSRRTKEMGLVTPSGKRLNYPFKGKILYRPIHDEALVKLAKEAGAEYLTESRVNDIVENTVILGNGKELTSKIIVGCGGYCI